MLLLQFFFFALVLKINPAEGATGFFLRERIFFWFLAL